MKLTPLVILEVFLLVFFASIYLYASLSRGKSREDERFEVALEKLSKLWTEGEVHGAEVVPPVASRTLPAFNSKELNEFYKNHLAPYVETALYSATMGPALDVIIKVLVILDTDGDCPSVVDAAGDPEADAYGSSYGLLKKVTLREHSIHVAEEAVRIISGRYKEPEMLLGRVLIVALAHDLGKIPRFRSGPAYVLGNHPAISAAVLEPLVTDLPGKEEVLKAVRDHHSATSSDPLIRILNEADRRAREREVGMLAGASALVPRGSFSWL
ncbi:MAG: HD domain-containing protein, partial [Deltaproteobacteria bacterium]